MTDLQGRIAIHIPNLLGGGQRSMPTLARGIAGRDCAADLMLAEAVGEFLDDVREPVRLVDLGPSRALTNLPALLRTPRREAPDAVMSAFEYAKIADQYTDLLLGDGAS